MDFEDFKSVPLLSAFPEHILILLYQLVKENAYPAGSVIMKEGDQGDSFFIVSSGELEVRKVINREAGEYKALTRIGVKEVFGEMAVFDQTPRSADVVALTDVVLWQITVPYLNALLKSDPPAGTDFLMAMMSLLIARLRTANQTIALLSEAGQIISSATELPTLIHRLFELIVREWSGSDAAIFATYNSFNDEFNVVEVMPTGEAYKIIPSVFEPSDRLVMTLTGNHEAILINQDVTSAQAPTFLLEGIFTQAHSLLAAPFWHADHLLGFIVLMRFDASDAFTKQQMVLLSGLCNMVAPAMATFRYRSDEEARIRLAKAKGLIA
jgi:CRP-like cAMP-binding protein